MENQRIYLDYNASSPLRPEARSAMIAALSEENTSLNASAVHHYGREGRRIVERARIQVAQLIGMPAAQIIFNSGATEGNNTVLNHFKDEKILVSAAEHPSVLEMPGTIKTPVDQNGLVNLDELEKLLKKHKPALTSCMWVNNESGVIQDVAKISALAHSNNSLFHCDATQAAGRIKMNTTGIDFLTLSAHKIGGPQGIGALAFGLCGQTPTLLFGGGQEKSARAGTENVAGIAGFGAAAQSAKENINEYQNLTTLRDKLESKIKQISPDTLIHGEHSPRVANTSFFSLPGQDSQSLLMAFDLEGIAVSNGSACSSGTVKPSHVLMAMYDNPKIASSGLRISMGWATKESDIERALDSWEKIYKRIKG